MPQKRKFKLESFLDILAVKSMSTGVIARKVKCHISTALRYLRELKAAKQVIEKRISNTINLWRVTSKRIMLIDVDSTIPNLALMKISTYHKARGDNVALVKLKLRRRKDGTLKEAVRIDLSDKPDKIYASIIFKKNKYVLDGVAQQYSEIDIGGSGYDLKKELQPEIEALKPDYSLYPELDYSIGFSSRGCIRNTKTCPFCIVPIKEGRFTRAQHPREWYNPEFEKITFLDNNILADKEWFMEITAWCIEKKLKTWFTQGLDIRLVDAEIARRLAETPRHQMTAFAWDHIEDETLIKEKIELLKRCGFDDALLRAKVQFYVYIDNDSDEEFNSCIYRCRELKRLGCNSYVMFNIDSEKSQRITHLRQWSNAKMHFWRCDIDEYVKSARISV